MAETAILEFRPRFSRTAEENRSAFIKFLLDNDRGNDATAFIAEVKTATSGRINRHAWSKIAERYAKLHWVN